MQFLGVFSLLFSWIFWGVSSLLLSSRTRTVSRTAFFYSLCVFIKLLVTAQPGPVIRILQCYTYESSLWGDQWSQPLRQLIMTLDKGDTFLMCVCVCVVITLSRLYIWYICQSCSWSLEQGQWIFPISVGSRLIILSRGLGLAVPFRVSPFYSPYPSWARCLYCWIGIYVLSQLCSCQPTDIRKAGKTGTGMDGGHDEGEHSK